MQRAAQLSAACLAESALLYSCASPTLEGQRSAVTAHHAAAFEVLKPQAGSCTGPRRCYHPALHRGYGFLELTYPQSLGHGPFQDHGHSWLVRYIGPYFFGRRLSKPPRLPSSLECQFYLLEC